MMTDLVADTMHDKENLGNAEANAPEVAPPLKAAQEPVQALRKHQPTPRRDAPRRVKPILRGRGRCPAPYRIVRVRCQ